MLRRALCSGWLLLAFACHEDLELISKVKDSGSGIDVDVDPPVPDAGRIPICNCGDGAICTAQGCVLLTSISAIATGAEHSCWVNQTELSCWGANSQRQLGTGDNMNRVQPARIGVRSLWVSVAAGRRHSCGVRDRAVYCWGDNSQGQLGVLPSAMTQPVGSGMGMGQRGGSMGSFRVDEVTNVQQVKCGGDNCCALRSTDGALHCWGANSEGSVGMTRTTSMPVYTPTQVSPGTTFTSFSVGFAHSCAIRNDRALLCWGRNNSGQLGHGSSRSPQATPTQVGVTRDWTWVAAGREHTCGIRSGGALFCWGANVDGQLGVARVGPDGTPNVYDEPEPVDSSTDWASVAAGAFHTCGIKSLGELRCWGQGKSGQLGSGVVDVLETPKAVGPPNAWRELALGEKHSCGLDTQGKLYGWGDNSQGQLGLGDTAMREAPAPLQ